MDIDGNLERIGLGWGKVNLLRLSALHTIDRHLLFPVTYQTKASLRNIIEDRSVFLTDQADFPHLILNPAEKPGRILYSPEGVESRFLFKRDLLRRAIRVMTGELIDPKYGWSDFQSRVGVLHQPGQMDMSQVDVPSESALLTELFRQHHHGYFNFVAASKLYFCAFSRERTEDIPYLTGDLVLRILDASVSHIGDGQETDQKEASGDFVQEELWGTSILKHL